MQKDNLYVKADFQYYKFHSGTFNSPIKTGFRPILWIGDRGNRYTSSSFIVENDIFPGETGEVQLIILHPEILGEVIPNLEINVGSVTENIGMLRIKHIIGQWGEMKVP